MKLTRDRLKHIIKEELKFLVKEQEEFPLGTGAFLRCPDCGGVGSSSDYEGGQPVEGFQCLYCKGKGKIEVNQKFNNLLKDRKDLINYIKEKNAITKPQYSISLQQKLVELLNRYYTATPGSGAMAERALIREIEEAKNKEDDAKEADAEREDRIFK